MLVSLMGRQEFYRKHLKTFVALAPCAFIHHSDADFPALYSANKEARELLKAQGSHQLMHQPLGNVSFGRTFLGTQEAGMQHIVGDNSDKDPSLCSTVAMTNMSGHFPAGTSFKSFEHLCQLYENFNITMYDYGAETNKKVYGGEKPPVYPLDRLTGFDIWLICGKGDKLVAPKDYNYLKELLEK